MEKENTCVPKRRTIEKTERCQKEANKPLRVQQTFHFEKQFGGKNTEKVTGNGKQKQLMIKVRKKRMRFKKQTFFLKKKEEFFETQSYEFVQLLFFLEKKLRKQRRETCEKKGVFDNEHTMHKKKKNERHDKNKINFENVKLCNITVLSCVMCVSCVVLPQTSWRCTHKVL